MKVTYIHHSSFLVETDENYFLFDYFEGELPEFKEDKPLLVFASHRHGDHFSPVIFELAGKHKRLVLYFLMISGSGECRKNSLEKPILPVQEKNWN